MQEIVRTALEDDGLVVVQTVPQRVLGISGARLVAVDVLCEAAGGDLVAVEVQKKKEEDLPRRMRYVRVCSRASRRSPRGYNTSRRLRGEGPR